MKYGAHRLNIYNHFHLYFLQNPFFKCMLFLSSQRATCLCTYIGSLKPVQLNLTMLSSRCPTVVRACAAVAPQLLKYTVVVALGTQLETSPRSFAAHCRTYGTSRNRAAIAVVPLCVDAAWTPMQIEVYFVLPQRCTHKQRERETHIYICRPPSRYNRVRRLGLCKAITRNVFCAMCKKCVQWAHECTCSAC